MAFRRYGSFKVAYPRPEVTIEPSGTEARARVPFMIVREGTPLPDLGGLYEDPEGWIEAVKEQSDPFMLELWLTKTKDGWKVQRALMQ